MRHDAERKATLTRKRSKNGAQNTPFAPPSAPPQPPIVKPLAAMSAADEEDRLQDGERAGSKQGPGREHSQHARQSSSQSVHAPASPLALIAISTDAVSSGDAGMVRSQGGRRHNVLLLRVG